MKVRGKKKNGAERVVHENCYRTCSPVWWALLHAGRQSEYHTNSLRLARVPGMGQIW